MKNPYGSPHPEPFRPSHPQSYPQILWATKNMPYITGNYTIVSKEKSEKSCSTGGDTIQLQLYGIQNHPARMLTG